MRIAIVTEHHCRDAFGGAEYRVSLMAQSLTELGHSVFYVCTSQQSEEWYSEDVHVIPIKTKRLSRRLGRNYFLYRSDLFRVLDRIQPDVIYQSVASAFTGVAASYARKRGCRMVWHIAHEKDICPERSGSVRGALFNYIDRRWTEFGIRSCDVIIGQAQYQDKLLRDRYGRKCDLIVGTSHPAPTECITKTEPATVVWIANLKPIKQPELFLRLASELGHREDTRFIMIGRPGSGSYRRRLEKEMTGLKRFSYLGELPIQEVNGILAEAQVFVNTSRHEGFPNTFIQAWHRQVPIVSLHVDPDGVLKRCGLGFHSTSFPEMVTDVERLIDDRTLRETMGRRAQAHALSHHSMGPNIAQIARCLAGLAS